MSGVNAALLGVECGATRSTAILKFLNDSARPQQIFNFGPSNLRLLKNEGQLEPYFKNVREKIEQEVDGVRILRIGIGMSGVREDCDRQAVREVVERVFPDLEKVWVGSDQETAIACLTDDDEVPKFIVICGTGSGLFGTNGSTTFKIGGYGHIVGDRGAGYTVAQNGLKAACAEYDLNNEKSSLLDSFMKAMDCESIEDVCTKSLSPEYTKSKLAALATLVLSAWESNDPAATKVVNNALDELAADAACLAVKLARSKPGTKQVSAGLTGSLLTKNEKFRTEFVNRVKRHVRKFVPGLTLNVTVLHHTFHGGLMMVSDKEHRDVKTSTEKSADRPITEEELEELILPIRTALSPTETRNPKSKNLDKMSISDAMDLWLEEEKSIYEKIAQQKPILEKIIARVAETFRNGGRLFYAGAGTSGRLGILDASECPPTFQSPPEWVQGIIAGGDEAIVNSRESAEDSVFGGSEAVESRGLNSKDILIGIASSGTTPFVWGGMYRAKQLGAFTCFLTFNPHLDLKFQPDETIVVNVGPEILTGSTRLKCGSGTKTILNMITTLAMVQFGKCLENLMVDLDPACQKLRERALRIVLTIVNTANEGDGNAGHIPEDVAQEILVRNNYDIKKTVQELKN